MEKYQVPYQSQMIDYEIHRKRIKNIHIRIKSGDIVYVSAPHKVSHKAIESILLKKAEWILHGLKHFQEKEQLLPKDILWEEGDLVQFLGVSYAISIKKAVKEFVSLEAGIIELHTKEPSNMERKKKLYQVWLREQAQDLFQQIMDQKLVLLSTHIKEKPLLKIRKMKARWGTCFSTQNTIQLNLELIKKPSAAIEYVVLHELAHFVHPNHSKAFYNFIGTYMPDFETRKRLLK